MSGRQSARVLAVVFALAAGRPALAQKSQSSGDVLFESARQMELVQGNLQGAIAIYQRIVGEHAGNRPLVASALLHIGQCHERLGQAEARKAYERIVRDFPDQPATAATARARLAALSGPPAPRPTQLSVRKVWAGPDVDYTGSPTSDGRFLSATDWNTGDIVVRDLSTGEMHPVRAGDMMKSGAHGLMPAFSPDDKLIAYAWFDGKEALYELRAIAANGTGERTLLHVNGGWVIPLTWSADSSQIAAIVDRPGVPADRKIVLVSASTGETRVVKALEPEAARIGRGSVDAGFARPLPDELALSPDKRYLAYDARQEDGQRDIFVIDLRGGPETTLVGHPADDALPMWTPDGRRVLFMSDRTGNPGLWSVEVADGRPVASPEIIKADIGRGFFPMGLTKAGALYYGFGTGMLEVYTATIDLAAPRILETPSVITQLAVGSNRLPSWSPDGRLLAYLTKRGSVPGSGNAVAVRTMATGQERVLDLRLYAVRRIAWFPDGKALVVTGLDEQQRSGVFRLDVATGALQTLIGFADASVAVIPAQATPDGKTLVYVFFDSTKSLRTVRARDLATGEERVIGQPSLGSPSALALSPDGRNAAVCANDKDKKGQAILVVPVSGGESREVCRFDKIGVLGGEVAWSPDGRYLLFNARLEGKVQLMVVSSEGGTPTTVGPWPEGVKNLSTFSLHPDGKHIAFGAGQGTSEVWVLENFLPQTKKGTH